MIDNGICVHVLFLPSFLSIFCLCVQEMAEVTAADLPPSPQSAPPTSSVPLAGIMAWASEIVMIHCLCLKEHVTVLSFE